MNYEKIFLKSKDIFWNFVFFSTEIEDFIKYVQNPELLKDIFLSNICINNRIILLDDIHKVPREYGNILKEMLKLLISREYPVFCIITSTSKKFLMEKYRMVKNNFLIVLK